MRGPPYSPDSASGPDRYRSRMTRTGKGGPRTPRSPSQKLEEYVRRVSSPKERAYFRAVLTELVENNVIPLDLLEHIPAPPEEAGKTRFDQLYDAAMSLVFPGYREETLGRLLGPTAADRENTRVWRAMFPAKFRLSHVLFRASSFQEAFALACDYACRMSLRLYRKVPVDLTVRVQFVSERAVRRMLDIRWANRKRWRRALQLQGRAYTPKEVYGARLAALGHPGSGEYAVAKYAEARDLRKVLKLRDRVRVSSVEKESFLREEE